MEHRIRLFARAREIAGTEVINVDLAEGARVGDLRKEIASRHAALAGLLERSALAVNDELADDRTTVPRGAEIAVLPPVSGG